MCDTDIEHLDCLMREAIDEAMIAEHHFLLGLVGKARRDAAHARWKEVHELWLNAHRVRDSRQEKRTAA
ncbi:hypothetical protein [Microvirga sp. M2]|uniref:hypothetical protein n=1 Tax=Microvirga sp. M2 TaxID=3073270 RepID=UPI0039C05B7D